MSTFWGRPKTPSEYSNTNQIQISGQWTNQGIRRPGTAPAIISPTRHKQQTTNTTTARQQQQGQLVLPPQIPEHHAPPRSANGLRSAGSQRGYSRERELGNRSSTPTLMDIVDPIEPGGRRRRRSKSRNRKRYKGKKKQRQTSEKTSTTTQRKRSKRKKRTRTKTKLPSTAPAGRSLTMQGPLITTPLPVSTTVTVYSNNNTEHTNNNNNNHHNNSSSNTNTPLPELGKRMISEAYVVEEMNSSDDEEDYMFDSQPTPRNDRGLEPSEHLINHAYVRGRDGEFLSYLPSHQIGTFHNQVSFDEWGTSDRSLYILADQTASNGGELLKSLNLSGCHGITEHGLESVLSGATQMIELNLSGCGSHLSDDILILVSSVCTLLQNLNVSSCRGFTDVGFSAVAGWDGSDETKSKKSNGSSNGGWDWEDASKNAFGSRPASRGSTVNSKDTKSDTDTTTTAIICGLKSLEQLSASNCPLLSDVSLSRLAKGCPELRTLDVSGCHRLTDDGLRELVDGAKHLRELLIHGNKKISGELFSVKANSHNDCSLFVCCGLRSIGMKGCYLLNDQTLSWLAQSCALLESLDVSECPRVSSRGVVQMIEKCPRLVSLAVIGCGTMNDSVGRSITARLPQIMSLDFAGTNGLTASSLASLIGKCRNVRHINFSGVPGLTDAVFTGEAAVDRNMEVLRQDPRYADSARTPVRSVHVGDCHQLTKDGFSAIAWLFRTAVVMDFSGCAQFGNTALYHVTEHCRVLNELNLNDCNLITDIGVKRISSRCLKLEILRLSVKMDSVGCTNIGDKSLTALLRRLRLLRTLEFNNRILVTGKSIPSGPAFRATMLRTIEFAGCSELRLSSVRTIVAKCLQLETIDLTRCRCAGKGKLAALNALTHLLPHPQLIKAVGGARMVRFRGLRSIPNHTLQRHQIYFKQRLELEHSSAVKLQIRWREWKEGAFTLMYLIIWTRNLKKKGEVEERAITIQKYYRRKIGKRLAWERREVVSAERIQRTVRSWIEYKKNFAAHMRVHACKRLQEWWRNYLYMKISLRDRIWQCVQEEKKKEEAERRKHEQMYFGARAMQCWWRRIRSVRILTKLQAQRKHAIYGSALIVPSKRWRRSKVHAPKHDQYFERSVIRIGETEQTHRPSTAPDGLHPTFGQKVSGVVHPDDVQKIRRYPKRYCERCTNRHAVVKCTVCLIELCPRCNVELHVVDRHGKTAKYSHHPKPKLLQPTLPADMRLEQSITIASSAWEDSEFLLRPVIHVRKQRFAVHEELLVAIERREEIRLVKVKEEEKKEQIQLEKCISIFAARWRGITARLNFIKLKESVINEKEIKQKKFTFDNAVCVQALFRAYSLRKWYFTLRQDDQYLFWRDVNRRKIKYLPGVTRQKWVIADLLLEKDFAEIINGKNRSFKIRFGSKVRRYETDIRNLASKVQQLHGDSGVFLKRWQALLEVGKTVKLGEIMLKEARDLESEGRRLEAMAQGFGFIMILMKQRLFFLTDRRAYEDRRDSVLRAQQKAFAIAKTNIQKKLIDVHETVRTIELMQAEPMEDFDAMNTKAEIIIAHANELEKGSAEKAEDVMEPRIPDEEYEELTEEEQHEYETARLLKEAKIKGKAEREAKAKAKRIKDRLKLWKAQWSKRNAWLRKEHKHTLHKAMKAERTVLAMAMALVETRTEELRLYKEYDEVQTILIKSIQAEIHYEAELMQEEIVKQILQATDGDGAKGILESVRKQVALRSKQHRLADYYNPRVLKCIKDSDIQTERRERFVVADWSDTKNMWAVYARPKRFDLQFSSDHWVMDPSNWLEDYKQKPWVDFMKSGKEESEQLKKMNARFGNALGEAQQEQEEKEQKEMEEKAVADAEAAIVAAKVKKQKADIKKITTQYGGVLSNLLTDVSPELQAAKEKARRLKMSRAARWKEDAYNLVMGPIIRKRTEMRRVQESIEHRQKASVGYVEAICGFHITTGVETAKFLPEQEKLKLENLPYYTKVPDNLGREWSVFLWVMKTIDQTSMITKVVVGSAVKYNKLCYLEPEALLDDGYERSNEIITEGKDSSQLVIWSKAEMNEKLVLHDVAVSFTDKTEKFLREDGYTKLDPDLGDLRMPPDARIWCKYGGREREKTAKAQDEKYYLDKIEGYREILKEEPDNKLLVKKIARLKEDLRQFRLNEEDKKKNKLRNMVEFLALSEGDMKRFTHHFTDIDQDNSGEIDLTEFFDYIDIDRTAFTDSLFSFLDESNDGVLDFGEFVHACGTICMWESKQILQFMFSMYDTAGNGYIVESQLETLLDAVRGDDPIMLTGTERVMLKFDKDGDGRVDWPEFQHAAARFPSAFIPAFQLMDTWRAKIMGKRFWIRKKKLFMKVRENMGKQREAAAEQGKAAAREFKAQKELDRIAAKRERDLEAAKSQRSPKSSPKSTKK